MAPTPDASQGGGDGIIRIGYTYDRNSLSSSIIDDQGNVTLYMYDNLDRRMAETKGLTVNTTPLDKAKILGPRQIVTPTVATIKDPAVVTADKIDEQLAAAKARLNAVATLFPPLADRLDDNPPTTIVYGYDQDDNVLIMEDENDSETFTKYDALNRPIAARVFRSGQADTHAGDAVFAPVPVSDPSNASTSFPAIVGTTAQNFEYDGLSRVTRATDKNEPADTSNDSAITYAYDSLGRIIEETQQIGGLPARVVSSGWRAEDLRAGLTYPNARAVDYTYDGLDRLATISDRGATQPIAQYDYIGPSRTAQRVYPINGTRMTYLDDTGATDVGYDGLRRPVQLRHLRADNSLLAGFSHTYDRMSNKLGEGKLHDTVNGEVYDYDSAYRLIKFDRTDATAIAPLHSNWTLDGAGNWQQVDSETREHSSINEIILRSGDEQIAIFFDDNGNVTDDGTFTFQWDAQNRLRRVTREAAGAIVAVYSYDAAGRRTRKEVSASGALDGVTDFYHDGWQVIQEGNGSGGLVRQYVYGRSIDEPLVLDRNLDGDGSAIGAGDERLFYHQNTVYSVFALTDITGTVVEGYMYDAYGRQTVIAQSTGGGDDIFIIGGVSSSDNPYLFTGRRLDPGTGLYYYRMRYFNTEQGRFMSRDPIGVWTDAMGLGNAYSYVGNNPLNRLDPMGEATAIEYGLIAALIGVQIVTAMPDFGSMVESSFGEKGSQSVTLVQAQLVHNIISIISQIAIPNLLRARASANQSSAISSLRTLVTAQSIYRESDKDADGDYDYSTDPIELGDSEILDQVLRPGQASPAALSLCDTCSPGVPIIPSCLGPPFSPRSPCSPFGLRS